MRNSNGSKCLLTTIMLTVLLAVIIPGTAVGQGRGKGHGRGGIFGSSHNKCGKFVNCHDARDGRWDGRGRRRNRISSIFSRNRRQRIRNRNLNDNWVRNRRYRNHDR